MANNKTERLTYIVQFECQHTRIFPDPSPVLGEKIWCPRCRVEREVISAKDEYHVRCRKCGYSRPFGVAKLQAEIAAGKHRVNKGPDHVVVLKNGHKIDHVFGQRNQTVIPMTSNGDPNIPF